MVASVEEAIAMIFDAGNRLNNSSWNLQLAPPGNEFHCPEYIFQVEVDIALAQAGMKALRRALRQQRKAKQTP
jgi:hypothetical protein